MAYYWVSSKGRIGKAEREGDKFKLREAFGDCFRSELKAKVAHKRMKRMFARLKGVK